jgi:hypothetical protein
MIRERYSYTLELKSMYILERFLGLYFPKSNFQFRCIVILFGINNYILSIIKALRILN